MDYAIGSNSLRLVCRNLSKHDAVIIADSLGPAMHQFSIVTPRRAAAFIAQCAHESGGFMYRRELWGPTSWQYNYAHMLGNQGMGDAFAYRGGGWIQLTGKVNYQQAGHALGLDLVRHPELMNQAKFCSLVSAWWWAAHGLNHLADRNDFLQITKTINGGTNGLASRYTYWAKTKAVAHFLTPRVKH